MIGWVTKKVAVSLIVDAVKNGEKKLKNEKKLRRKQNLRLVDFYLQLLHIFLVLFSVIGLYLLAHGEQ